MEKRKAARGPAAEAQLVPAGADIRPRPHALTAEGLRLADTAASPSVEALQVDLTIRALAAGGFAGMDEVGGRMMALPALLALQQFTGNQYVAQVLAAPPSPAPRAEYPEAPTEEKKVELPPPGETPAAPVPGATAPARGEKLEAQKRAPAGAKKSGAEDRPEVPPPAEAQAEISREGGYLVKSGAPGGSGSAPAGGGKTEPAPEVQAWSAKARSTAAKKLAPPPTPRMAGSAKAVNSGGGAVVAKRKGAGKDHLKEAKDALPPPPKGAENADIPLDPLEKTVKETLDKAGSKRLSNQYLSALKKSRGYSKPPDKFVEATLPVVGASPPEPDREDKAKDAKAGAPVAKPGEKSSTRKKTEDTNKKLAEPPEKKPVEGPPKPVAFVDEGPKPVKAVPAEKKASMAGALASLLGKADEQAKEFVTDAEKVAYPNNSLHEAEPSIAEKALPDEKVGVVKELNGIRDAAGLTEKDIKAAEKKAKEATEKKADDAQKGVHKADLDSKRETKDAAAKDKAKIAAAGAAVKDHVESKREAAGGKPDEKYVRDKEQRVVDKAMSDAAAMRAAYRSASEKRESEIQRTGLAQIGAYDRTAKAEANKIKALYKDNDDLGRVESRPSLNWGDDRIKEVEAEVKRLQKAAKDEAEKYRQGVAAAETEAIKAVHAWADTQLGREKGFWERILELIREWINRAKKDAEAWEAQRNANNAAAMVSDLEMLDKIRDAAIAGNKEELKTIVDGLTEEEQIVFLAFFDKGGDAISAVAAGLLLRIKKHRAKELIERFRDAGLALNNWEKLNTLGAAQTKGFDAGALARQVRTAVKGWGTNEEKVYSAITRRTPVQIKAIELAYEAIFHRDMRDDIDDDMDGDEWKRAKAALEGDPSGEDVFAIHDALYSFSGSSSTIMEILRNKSPEEREAIIKRYDEEYGVDLKVSLATRLDPRDRNRANLLLKGDVDGADAVAIRAGLKDHIFGGDVSEVDAVYANIRKEVEAEAAAKNMTTAEVEAEVKNRADRVKAKYNRFYAKGAADGLEKDYKAELSGGERDLALALDKNDRKEIDTARIEAARGFWRTNDDKVVEVLRDQRKRAEIEVKRDMMVHFKEDMAKAKPRWDEKRIKEEFEKRDKVASEKIDEHSKGSMDALAANFDVKHPEMSPGALGKVLDKELSGGLGGVFGNQGDIAKALVKGGGRMSDEEELHYAIRGPGTDEETLKRILKGKTPDQIKAIRDAYNNKYKPATLDKDIAGDTSGRFAFDCKQMLKGEPQTAAEKVQRLKEQRTFERGTGLATAIPGKAGVALDVALGGNAALGLLFAGEETDVLDSTIAELEKQQKEYEDKLKAKGISESDTDKIAADPELRKMKDRFDRWAGYGETDVESMRSAVDSIADTASMIAAVVVGVVAAIAVEVFSAGTATPAVIAGIAAAAGVVAGIGVKMTFKGQAYGWEDLATDLAVGAVDVAAAVLTAGIGNALLKSGMLARMAEGPLLRRLAANGLAQGVEGLVGALPSGLASTLLNEDTWKGDPLKNLIFGVAISGAAGFGGGGALGALHGIKAPPGHGNVPHTGGPHGTGEIHAPEVKLEPPGAKIPDAGAEVPRAKVGPAETDVHAPPGSKADIEAHGKAKGELEAEAGAKPRPEVSAPEGAAGPEAKAEAKALAERTPSVEKVPRTAADTEAGLIPVTRPAPELEPGLPRDLRKKVPIEVDPSLEPTTVKIRYEETDGVITRIWIVAGAEASIKHIAEHAATVRAMQKYAGFTGRVRKVIRSLANWVNINGEPPPGTKAWEAILETKKLEGIIDARIKMLESGRLSMEEEAKVVQEIAHLNDQLRIHEQTAARMDMSPGEGFVAAKGNKGERFVPEGYVEPPKGHHYRYQDGEYILAADPNWNGKKFRLKPGSKTEYEPRPKRESFDDFKAKMAKEKAKPLTESIPEIEKAMDGVKLSPDERGAIRRWEPTLAAMRKRLDTGDFDQFCKGLVSHLEDGYGQGAYDKFRHKLRKRMVDYVMSLPLKDQHDALKNLFKSLPPGDSGSIGGLFRAYREQRIKLPPKEAAPSDPLKKMAVIPENGDVRPRVSLTGGGDADGAIRVTGDMTPEGGPPAGMHLVDDKGGANPFDRKQAGNYSDQLYKNNGKLDTGEAKYDGLVYFFHDKDAAEGAVRFLDQNKMHPNMRAGYFDGSGKFVWQPRKFKNEPVAKARLK